jgi:cytoskeletal protein CcmA (bactofilin family)
VKNGEDVGYRTDSTIILKGTLGSGASVVPGKDGQITMVNNSATLLKGTKETDADLEVGLDPGEDPPGEFDGVFTLVGKLEVIEEITCKKIISSQGADITGEITLAPRTVPEDEHTQPEVTDVIIDGGLKTSTLTVVGEASFGKSLFNDSIEVNGDIKIDNGAIKSNGITISFGWRLSVNAEISANDFIW